MTTRKDTELEITSSVFGTVALVATVVARDDGMFFFRVYVKGSLAANPISGCTIFAGSPEAQSGECGSAHEAEFLAAKAMVDMAGEQRLLVAAAEAKLSQRNSNHVSAQAATERLAKL